MSPDAKPLDVLKVLHATSSRQLRTVRKGATVYSQGTDSDSIFYIERGRVRLSVTSRSGKQAVVAVLEAGEFFGEGCLANQPIRMSSATAMVGSAVIQVAKHDMQALLKDQPAFSERFLSHMLVRNIRIEADLVATLFNGTEKRLARALLLLARYGQAGPASFPVPAISQQVLADMVGTTRPRVNFFMNKFRRLGFIDYKQGIVVNQSLLTVVLHE